MVVPERSADPTRSLSAPYIPSPLRGPPTRPDPTADLTPIAPTHLAAVTGKRPGKAPEAKPRARGSAPGRLPRLPTRRRGPGPAPHLRRPAFGARPSWPTRAPGPAPASSQAPTPPHLEPPRDRRRHPRLVPPARSPGPALQWRPRRRRPDRHVPRNQEAWTSAAAAARATPPQDARPRARPSLRTGRGGRQVPPPCTRTGIRLASVAVALGSFPDAP
ncbi:lysine-rich arabinogalactan protein 19-like [Choloepus didactylus]|uniref:lysine-rich arabinogalactan protein 19-like n=1 Tax=Choloepus didactylus TaxID=27675 RepID=UPI00189F5E12|nr:lysine-rich arabinogalactan protein 19-like [Choloepus didactylus]